MGVNKRQNKIWEYRAMLQQWRKAGVMIWAGYILGFPTDTPETIRRDIEIVKKELPIDIMEFMCLTPLPGSEDHQKLYQKGVPMDPDMNKYDIEHVCTAHPRMSKEEWEQAYRDAWASFYSDEHVATILKRARVNGLSMSKVNSALTVFGGAATIEDVHPMQFGLGRRKVRTQRRHGMPIVNPFIFYPWRAYDFAKGTTAWLKLFWRHRRMRKRIQHDPNFDYIDESLRVTTDGSNRPDEFMEVYADKIPATHGAPKKKKAEVAAA
jgi:hypothetical protein